MLVAIGRPAPGNWPRKPRRPEHAPQATLLLQALRNTIEYKHQHQNGENKHIVPVAAGQFKHARGQT